MAKNNKKRNGLFGGLFKTNKKIKTNFDILDNTLNDLYSSTYFSNNDDEETEKVIRQDIDDAINNIMNKDYANTNISNMSKMYNKLASDKANSNKGLIDALDMFNDKDISANIIANWMQSKWVRDLDSEIDMILKYMPKLKEALACRKDCVLSADHFSKDFISYHNISNKGKEELFNRRMEELKKVYSLNKKYDEWYDRAQTYGEAFVYVAPYNKEFERILNINKRFGTVSTGIVESGSFTDEKTNITEDYNINNITVTFNVGYIPKYNENMKQVHESANPISMKESFMESAGLITESKYDKIEPHIISDDLKFPKELEDNTSSTELIIDKKEAIKEKITVPGAILKTLDRDKVIPFYIDDICLGYYYIEVAVNIISGDINGSMEYLSNVTGSDSISRFNKTTDLMNNDNNANAVDVIVNKLAEKIDRKFINANQDLKKELYVILKHSSLFNKEMNSNTTLDGNINITFLSPDDVTHIYFKQDPITKRGISDLAYSLFPAKLYTCMYITTVLGQITRGQDKRVYYVKQNVETNISKTLLNVINQIKKGNMGARQMENLGNILNITGKFNDLVIPLSPSGEPPVQFEIMPGQQFSDNSELMTALEKMSIDPIVPYDLVEARQSLDYAIQATMSNSKLMRATYNRQDIFQDYCSDISSKLYNYEYEENEYIDITLPAPSFLNMTNGSQLIEGTINYINTLVNQEIPNEDDDVKAEFIKIASRYYMPTHININLINKFVKEAKMSVATKKSNEQEEEE